MSTPIGDYAPLAERPGAEDRVETWSAARDEIRTAIHEQGWSDGAGAYAQAFGSREQAFSHVRLVNAAWAITERLRG